MKKERSRGELESPTEPSRLQSYHQGMRSGLFFILMVVLVLRGLTGTAMAAGLLPPLTPVGAHHEQVQDWAQGDALVVTAVADDSSHHHGSHASPVDHPLGATASCEGATGACGQQEHHASTCSVCEICHSAMLTPFAPLAQAALPLGHTRPLASAPFDSALAALTIKPPIA